MTERFDIAVIGGGVVGLAILRRFAMAGWSCVLFEKGADILSGASKGNSALLHTGFDAPIGSLELQCMQAGHAEYLTIKQKLNLPLLKTSALVVAWNEEEQARLDGIIAKAHANGVTDTRLLSKAETLAREPNLSQKFVASVLVSNEHVIDPWSTPLAYARQAMAHGAVIHRDTEVKAAHSQGDHWVLTAGEQTVTAQTAINAAGLYGDHVEALAGFDAGFAIKPRKGQFVIFDKPASRLVKSIILPVPTERTKGVVLFPTIFGNLGIGPTAEETDERETATCNQQTLEMLRAKAIDMVPALARVDVNATYAGLRPATAQSDYMIKARQNWITVAGIRSTGLTASLGIAQHVEKLHAAMVDHKPNTPLQVWPHTPNLAEHKKRPYQNGGEIVCHCEWVTRQEITAALENPLPARDISGLKRRTRAMLGRCQGFNCGAEIHSMLQQAIHDKT
jgi:glycerol-3-phosphate dehydrogenase